MWQEAARPDGNRSPGMNARFGQRTRHSPLSNSVLRLRALPNAVESVCVAAPWASRQRCFCSSVPDKSKKSFRSSLTECAPRASLAGADGAGMMSRQSSHRPRAVHRGLSDGFLADLLLRVQNGICPQRRAVRRIVRVR